MAFPHRIISAVAKRITVSLEFRCGDTSFISSLERESKRSVPQNEMDITTVLTTSAFGGKADITI